MTEEKERALKNCFETIVWMAVRYANGRHTYAPYIVRDAIKTYRELYPEWNLQIDRVVLKEYEDCKDSPDLQSFPEGDWLVDLFKEEDPEAL